MIAHRVFLRIYYTPAGKVDDEAMSDYEALVGIVAPGKTLTVDVEPKNGFVIRYEGLLSSF